MFQSLGRDSGRSDPAVQTATAMHDEFQSLGRDSGRSDDMTHDRLCAVKLGFNRSVAIRVGLTSPASR